MSSGTVSVLRGCDMVELLPDIYGDIADVAVPADGIRWVVGDVRHLVARWGAENGREFWSYLGRGYYM